MWRGVNEEHINSEETDPLMGFYVSIILQLYVVLVLAGKISDAEIATLYFTL